MVREFIQDRIDTAHALIDNGQYQEAVELLKNLKYRIHQEEPLQDIDSFETEHDTKLKERLSSIQTSVEHQLIKHSNELDQLHKYATAYLKFYDTLTKDYDLF